MSNNNGNNTPVENVTFSFVLKGYSKSGKAVYSLPGVTGSLAIRKSLFGAAGNAPAVLQVVALPGAFAAPVAAKIIDPAVVQAQAEKAQARATKAQARAAKLLAQVAKIQAAQAAATPVAPVEQGK